MATLLWYILGLMTGLALLPIFGFLGRRIRPAADAGYEKKVYEDQLQALEAEAERGLIDKQELEAARVEISRRLLAAADRESQTVAARPAVSWVLVAFGSAGVVVLVALGGYLALGRPDLVARAPAPAQQQEQQVPGQAEMAARLANVEADLRANPENGGGWQEAGALYFALGRYEEATKAYANAVRVLGDSAQLLGDYGEAMTQANDSMVSDDARKIFERALKLDPTLVQARFYLALAKEQRGQLKESAEAWKALLDDAPADAFWKPLVEQRLNAVNSRLGSSGGAAGTAKPDAAASPAPEATASETPATGPSEEAMRAAEEMPAEARDDMVKNMVTRLAARLEANGDDLDGWVMLMRSYMVLDRRDDAKEAANTARRQFADDEAALKKIEEAEKSLGL